MNFLTTGRRSLLVGGLLALPVAAAAESGGLEDHRWEDRVFLVVADGGPVRVPFKKIVENPTEDFLWKRRVGCAVYVGGERHLLTSLSVVGNNSIVEVFRDDGEHVVARVLGTDKHLDLALLEAVDELPGIEGLPDLTAEVSARPGAPCMVVGSAYGRSLSACRGAVGGRMVIMPTGVPVQVQRIDVPIYPGDSGGPVLDPEGRFLGIVSAVVPGETEGAVLEPSGELREEDFVSTPVSRTGFAVPAETCIRAYHELRDYGRVRRGFLGVQMPLTATVEGGAKILHVVPGSPAATFGIRAGDRIMEFGPRPVTDARQFSAMVAATLPNMRMDVRLERDGHEHILSIRVGEARQQPAALPEPIEPDPVEGDPELAESTGSGAK